MNELLSPPPGGLQSSSNKRPIEVASNLMTYNKMMILGDTSEGPKFLTISRIHPTLKMTEVSMFLIKNSITATCGIIKEMEQF